jgi:hypothetical protein
VISYPKSASQISVGAPVICLHLVHGYSAYFISIFCSETLDSLLGYKCILPDIVNHFDKLEGKNLHHAVVSGWLFVQYSTDAPVDVLN